MDNPELQYTIGFGEKSVDWNPEKSWNWTIEYNLFTKYVSHIHAKTFLNSICWSHFQKFLRRTSKMLLHQKEASLGILSAFMYNYKQLNIDKKNVSILVKQYSTHHFGGAAFWKSPHPFVQ